MLDWFEAGDSIIDEAYVRRGVYIIISLDSAAQTAADAAILSPRFLKQAQVNSKSRVRRRLSGEQEDQRERGSGGAAVVTGTLECTVNPGLSSATFMG